VQVKLRDLLRTCAIPERLRGVITTRRYTNPRLPYLTLIFWSGFITPITTTHQNVLWHSFDLTSDQLQCSNLQTWFDDSVWRWLVDKLSSVRLLSTHSRKSCQISTEILPDAQPDAHK